VTVTAVPGSPSCRGRTGGGDRRPRPGQGGESRGVGKNRATNRLWLSSSLNTCQGVIVTITDRMAA